MARHRFRTKNKGIGKQLEEKEKELQEYKEKVKEMESLVEKMKEDVQRSRQAF